MKLLAIDTSENTCSTALLIGEKIFARYKLSPKKHTTYILPMIDKLLSDNDLSLSDLDALAFGKGPGSFTGLRIAAGVIQGISYSANLPVISVSTLRALAQSAFRQFGARYVISALDARMDQIYIGFYKLDETNCMQKIVNDSVICPSNIPTTLNKNWMGIGSGWDNYGKIINKKINIDLRSIHVKQFVNAQDIATIAAIKYQEGKILAAKEVVPCYIREFK